MFFFPPKRPQKPKGFESGALRAERTSNEVAMSSEKTLLSNAEHDLIMEARDLGRNKAKDLYNKTLYLIINNNTGEMNGASYREHRGI